MPKEVAWERHFGKSQLLTKYYKIIKAVPKEVHESQKQAGEKACEVPSNGLYSWYT